MCLAQLDRGVSCWSLVAWDKYGPSVQVAKGLAAGPVIRLSGIGERCVPKSSFFRCSPPKTEVGEGFGPVPRLLEDGEVSPPKSTPGMGQDDVV